MMARLELNSKLAEVNHFLEKRAIGKKHALKKYDQFTINTSCFWGSTRTNVTLVVQFHEIFATKIMNKLICYYC